MIRHGNHRFSVSAGYHNRIPLEVISNRNNLELLAPRENMRKGKRCSISLTELGKTYQPNALVTKAAAMLNTMPVEQVQEAVYRIGRKLRQFREARSCLRPVESGNLSVGVRLVSPIIDHPGQRP